MLVSYRKMKGNTDIPDTKWGKLKWVVTDVISRKALYLPLIAHLSDTATDFASVAEFGILAMDHKDCGLVFISK